MKASLNESEVIGSQSSKEQKIWPVKKHLPRYSDTLHCRNIYLQQGKFSQSSQLKKKKNPQASCLALIWPKSICWQLSFSVTIIWSSSHVSFISSIQPQKWCIKTGALCVYKEVSSLFISPVPLFLTSLPLLSQSNQNSTWRRSCSWNHRDAVQMSLPSGLQSKALSYPGQNCFYHFAQLPARLRDF